MLKVVQVVLFQINHEIPSSNIMIMPKTSNITLASFIAHDFFSLVNGKVPKTWPTSRLKPKPPSRIFRPALYGSLP